MAGAFLKIEVDRTLVSRAFDHALEALGGDLSPILHDIGEALKISHRQGFQDQRDRDGNPWAPLSPQYRDRKKRNKDRILTLDGYLQGLLRYRVEGDALLFGTDRPYGAVHQFGYPARNIPARPWLGLSIADREEIVEIVRDHLDIALKGG